MTKTKETTAKPSAAEKAEWIERRERFLLDADAVDAFTIEQAPDEEAEK